MSYSKFEFTQISRLEVEALGKPGNRTFRIITESNNSVASIWIEKEHLLQLSLSVKQLLDSIVEGEDAAVSGMAPTQFEAPETTKLDFKISRLSLRHDDASGMFLIEFNDADSVEDKDETPDLRLWVNLLIKRCTFVPQEGHFAIFVERQSTLLKKVVIDVQEEMETIPQMRYKRFKTL